MFRSIVAPAALALVLLGGGSGRAAPSVDAKLREQLKPLAERLLLVMNEEEQTTIEVGEFSGRDDLNFGPGFQRLLTEELNALRPGVVNPKSPLSVRGDYDYADEPGADGRPTDLKVIRVSLRIVKTNGEIVGKLAREIERPTYLKDSDVIAAIVAAPVQFSPASTRKQLNEQIRKAKEEPKYETVGTKLSSAAGSPYAIELLVAPKEQAPADAAAWAKVAARPIGERNGFPFVDIKRDEVYAVRVHNKTPHHAAVTLSIDGLDVFGFTEVRTPEGRPKYTHFVVPPGASLITGWHKTNDRADSFLVTEYGKGASKLRDPNRGKVGVLTATFALAWQGDQVPEAEKGSRNAGGNETGFGPPTKVNLKESAHKVGVIREVISARYTH